MARGGGAGKTLYGRLAIGRGADNAQIRSAYRRQALLTHPDKGGGTVEDFLEVVEAFEVLSDSVRRLAYDQELLRSGLVDPREASPDASPAAAATEAPAPAGACTGPGRPAGAEEPRPREGWGATEEQRRAARMWLDLLDVPASERPARVEGLSCRAAEVLLAYARSRACCGGAPVVAADGAGPGGEEVPLAAAGRSSSGGGISQAAESCAASLLALPAEAGAQPAADAGAGDAPPAKRRCVGAPGTGGGRRAWICLGRLKVCTGASQDLAEAINWHILLVRMKQLFRERRAAADGGAGAGGEGAAAGAFAAAARGGLEAALRERAAEGGGADPRLRFVTECPMPGSGVLFTPATWDLETALRQHDELETLLSAGAGRDAVLAAINRMTMASQAAEEEQRGLAELLEGHLRAFHKLLRWRGGRRPEGVNAALVRGGAPAAGGGQAPRRAAVAYAELWRERGSEERAGGGGVEAPPVATSPEKLLAPLCRGPRRRKAEEARADFAALHAARASGGDAAAVAEAARLYKAALPVPAAEAPALGPRAAA